MAEITYGGRVLTHEGLEVSIKPRTFSWDCQCGKMMAGYETEAEAERFARLHTHRPTDPRGWDE